MNRPVATNPLPAHLGTSQKPVSAVGWGLALASGLLFWGLFLLWVL